MKVIKVDSGLFKDAIVVKAIEFEECQILTLFGIRKYFVDKDTKVRIKVPKNWCVEVNENYDLQDLVRGLRRIF